MEITAARRSFRGWAGNRSQQHFPNTPIAARSASQGSEIPKSWCAQSHEPVRLESESAGEAALRKLGPNRAGFYALRMDRLRRIVFRFEDGNVHNVELVDYHG